MNSSNLNLKTYRTGLFNHRTVLAASLWCIGCTAAMAADQRAAFQGYGRASHPVQQVRVVVDVNAKCFKSAVDAYEAANRVVSQAMKALEPKIQAGNQKDRVIHQGISTSPYIAYRPNSSIQICPGTYQAEGRVTLMTSALENFGRSFAEIQQSVLSLALLPASESSESVALSIGTPERLLYPETTEKLQLKAVQKAKRDAIKKFEAACPGTPYQIVSVSDPVLEYRYKSLHAGMAFQPIMSEPAPIRFEELGESYSLHVNFSYVGTCTSAPSAQ